MTLQVTLSPKTEATLKERAAAVGEDLTSFAAHVLERAASQSPLLDTLGDSSAKNIHGDNEGAVETEELSHEVREFDRALDELFAGDARPMPEANLSYSREDIYFDHD